MHSLVLISAYYQVALTWLDGKEAGWGIYDRINDADVGELLEKVNVDTAEDLQGLAGRLEVVWEDGSKAVKSEMDPVGEPSNPLTDEQLLKKFTSMAIPVYGEERTGEIVKLIERLEECENSMELPAMLA